MPFDIDKLAKANTPAFARAAIAKISEDIFTSPALRAEFLQDPKAYVQARYAPPGPEETQMLMELQSMVSLGACCSGCGCPPIKPHA